MKQILGKGQPVKPGEKPFASGLNEGPSKRLPPGALDAPDAFEVASQQVIDVAATPKGQSAESDPRPALPAFPRRWVLDHLRRKQYPAPPKPVPLAEPFVQPKPSLPDDTPQPRRMINSLTSGDWEQLEEGPRSPAAAGITLRDGTPQPEVHTQVPLYSTPAKREVPLCLTPPKESPRESIADGDLWKCAPTFMADVPMDLELGTPPLAPEEEAYGSPQQWFSPEQEPEEQWFSPEQEPEEQWFSPAPSVRSEGASTDFGHETDLNFFKMDVGGKQKPASFNQFQGTARQPESEPSSSCTKFQFGERVSDLLRNELGSGAGQMTDEGIDDEEDEEEILRLLMAEGDCPEVAVPPQRGHAPWVLETWKPFSGEDNDNSEPGSPMSQSCIAKARQFMEIPELPNCIGAA